MKISQKKLLVSLTILLLVLVLLAGCTTKEQKIGVIDMDKVIQESPKAQEYQNQLDKKGAEIQEKYKIDDENLSDEEKQKMQEDALKEFVDAKKQLEDNLNKDIDKAVKEIADEKKLDVVFYKQSVRYGGEDITEEVINKLK